MDINRNYITELSQFLGRILTRNSTEIELFENIAVQLTDSLPRFAFDIPLFGDEKQAFLVWSVDTVKESNNKRNSNSDAEPTLELTGSPLQCSFGESPEKEDFKSQNPPKIPINIHNARMIMSCYNEIVSNSASDPHAMYVLCDGRDTRRTIVLGAKKCTGRLSQISVTYSWHQFAEQFPTMDHFKCQHQKGILHKKIRSKGLEVHCIVSSGDYCHDSSSSNHSDVICTWDNVNKLLESPNKDASFVMRFFVNPADPRSKLHDRYKDLNLLESFADGLETREVVWVKSEEDVSAVQRLTKILEDIVARQLSREKAASAKDCTVTGMVGLKSVLDDLCAGDKRNTDSIHMLWSILKGCCSYQELVECLTLVLTAVKYSTIRPSFRNKATEFAKLVHSIQYNREKEIPTFSDLLPLKLLVEIGVEKFTKDYISAFAESGIITQNTMSHFISAKANLKEAIECLYKLQSAAELLVLFQSFVEPPQVMLFGFMKRAMEMLEKSEMPKGPHVFQFPLEQYVFQQLVEDREVLGDRKIVWQMCMHSEQGNYSVNTKFNICTRIPTCINWLDLTMNDADDMQTTVLGRYCLTYTEVQDDVC